MVEGNTCLNGGKSIDESKVTAAFRDDFFNPLFFPEIPLEDELDFESIVTGDGHGDFISYISHGRCPLLKTENPDTRSIEETRASSLIANIRQSFLQKFLACLSGWHRLVF